jgi:hypothetical protein
MSHRDTLTGTNGHRTPRVQAEVFKIAEWLIQNRGIKLLLPEGFFVERREKASKNGLQYRSEAAPLSGLSAKSLEEKLSQKDVFVNAEILLMRSFPLIMKQIEDRDLYQKVYGKVQQLVQSKGNLEKSFIVRAELAYYEKKRIGTMLQKIPQIVTEEFREGRIHSKRALFTIGLSHIPNIMRYLDERRIAVLSPPFASSKYDDYIDELNLAKEDFGVSIILPKTLADDPKTLERNKLGVF